MDEPSEISPPLNRAKSIFLGPHGLRAGWRLLIFFAILAFLTGLAGWAAGEFFTGGIAERFTPSVVIVTRVIALAIVLFATWVMSRFEHRGLGDYGFPGREMFRRPFWAGAAWGFIMLSAIVALMALSHAYSISGLALRPANFLPYAFLWLLGFWLVGLHEETLFRGYAQFTLTTGLGFWPAAGITCVIFALAHITNSGENWIGVANIVVIAVFLCLALRRTGTLWFAIGWHMAFDWGESFFYSVPDSGLRATGHLFNATIGGSKWLSGGTVGPEASIFNLIVSIAGIYLLAKVHPEAKYPAATETIAAPTPPPQFAEAPAAEDQLSSRNSGESC